MSFPNPPFLKLSFEQVTWEYIYSDQGSRAAKNASIWKPTPKEATLAQLYAPVGDFIHTNWDNPEQSFEKQRKVLFVLKGDESIATPAQAVTRIWADDGSGAYENVALFELQPKNDSYVALGQIAFNGGREPNKEGPDYFQYYCVHKDYLVKSDNDFASSWKTEDSPVYERLWCFYNSPYTTFRVALNWAGDFSSVENAKRRLTSQSFFPYEIIESPKLKRLCCAGNSFSSSSVCVTDLFTSGPTCETIMLKYCQGSNLEKDECKSYATRNPGKLDAHLYTYANSLYRDSLYTKINLKNSVAACFMPRQFIDRLRTQMANQTGVNKEVFPTQLGCIFPACAASTVRPNKEVSCESNIVNCINNIDVDVGGSITGKVNINADAKCSQLIKRITPAPTGDTTPSSSSSTPSQKDEKTAKQTFEFNTFFKTYGLYILVVFVFVLMVALASLMKRSPQKR